MISKNVTITSKNQITLPADYVKQLNLAKNRVLRAEVHGESIILSLQPTLRDSMQKYWDKHNAAHPLTDEEIKKAIRARSVEQITKNT